MAPFFSLLIRLVLCTIYPEWIIVFHIMLDISALWLKPTEYVLVTDRFKDYLQVSLKVKLVYIDIRRAAFIIFNNSRRLLPLQPKLPKTILIPYGGCFHNSQYRFCFDIRNRLLKFLSKLHLFWYYSGISIKWTPLVQKSVRVIQMSAL